MVRVTVECCLQEKAWNPYYALLLAKLCEASKSHKITLQVGRPLAGWLVPAGFPDQHGLPLPQTRLAHVFLQSPSLWGWGFVKPKIVLAIVRNMLTGDCYRA